MAKEARIVAELGRPETAQETADRKAAFSASYRSSKNVRNLVAALLATVAVVVVIMFAVPRGTPPEAEPIDVAAVAASYEAAEGHPLVVPDAPDSWRVNSATIENDDVPRAWTIVYAPEKGFLRVAQGFEADPAWPARVLAGADPAGTVTIDGVTWTQYDITDPSRAGNVSVAMSTDLDDDTVLIYGSTDEKTLEQAAASVAASITDLREEMQ